MDLYFLGREIQLFKVWDEKDEMRAFNEINLIFVSCFYRFVERFPEENYYY